MRCVLGAGDGSEIGVAGALGIAFLNSWASRGPDDQLCFVFPDLHDNGTPSNPYGGDISGKIMAAGQDCGGTVSHEMGHTLGLEHFDDGRPPENAPNDISIMFNG